MTVEGVGVEGATRPQFICNICGRDKPVQQVFQCTICLKDFCVIHIGPWLHDCYTNE